jgi:hypothetical protein
MRGFFTIVTAVGLMGCFHQPKRVTVDANLGHSIRPKAIMLTTTQGERRIVRKPEVRGDTLYAWSDESLRVSSAFALSDISYAYTLDTLNYRIGAIVGISLIALGYVFYQLDNFEKGG